MRPVFLLALVFPLVASAQLATDEPVPPPAAAPAAQPMAAPAAKTARPRWSFGAGVYSQSTVLLLPGSSLLGYGIAQVPGATASLERRLSDRSWLVVGVNGAVARTDQDLPPDVSGTRRYDLNTLSIEAGVRHVLTPAGAPVDVSALGLVDAGVLDATEDRSQFTTDGLVDRTYHDTGWQAGASLGVAIDRELTGGLSLRVASPLLAAAYTSTRTRISGQPTLDGSDFSVRAVLAPRLELRLAF